MKVFISTEADDWPVVLDGELMRAGEAMIPAERRRADPRRRGIRRVPGQGWPSVRAVGAPGSA